MGTSVVECNVSPDNGNVSASQTFQRALAFVLTAEGADSNDPNDPGGLTRFGIAQTRHPEVDVSSLTLAQAQRIYQRDYWDPIHGDQLPRAVAFVLLDTAVNLGVARAIGLLQLALGVESDGIMGSRTISATSRQQEQILPRLLARRVRHYIELAEYKPRFRTFLNGWLVRCFEVYKSALEDA